MGKNAIIATVGIIVIVVIGGGYLLLHNSATGKPVSTTTPTPSGYSYATTTPSTTASTKTSPTASSSNSVYEDYTSSSTGTYLADTKGKTLYTYSSDTVGVSKCTGLCIATWPPYKPGSTTNLPTNITIITRSDGTKQYAWKGYPLYYYVGDITAGQVNGNGVGGFSIAK